MKNLVIKMELHGEIKELFDKFDCGHYKYEKNGNHIDIVNFYNDLYLHACFNDDYCTITINNGEIDYHYSSRRNNEGFDSGDAIFVNERTQQNIQNIVLNAKHYLEENGFDEIAHFRNIVEDLSFWIQNKFEQPEERAKQNIDSMIKIHQNFDGKMYWID